VRTLNSWTRNLAAVALLFAAVLIASMLMISGTRSLEALRTQAHAEGDLTPRRWRCRTWNSGSCRTRCDDGRIAP
jgi:hypothetical protein